MAGWRRTRRPGAGTRRSGSPPRGRNCSAGSGRRGRRPRPRRRGCSGRTGRRPSVRWPYGSDSESRLPEVPVPPVHVQPLLGCVYNSVSCRLVPGLRRERGNAVNRPRPRPRGRPSGGTTAGVHGRPAARSRKVRPWEWPNRPGSSFLGRIAAGWRRTSEEKTMVTDTTFSVTRRTLTTPKPFDEFIGELEKRSPVVPPSKLDELIDSNLPPDQLRARVEGLIGSSGFVFFLKIQHDRLFSHFGRARASVQYAIGNPLIAKEVSDKAPAVCLYTPFRLAVYESPETRETVVSYDSPASLFGSFGVPEAAEIGAMLEGKLRDLLNQCL